MNRGYIYQIIETETQPALVIKIVTSVSNLPNEGGRIYGSIVAYLTEKGEQPLGPAFIAYYNMDSSYEDLAKWINDRGFVPAGVVYEYYYNSPLEADIMKYSITVLRVLPNDQAYKSGNKTR